PRSYREDHLRIHLCLGPRRPRDPQLRRSPEPVEPQCLSRDRGAGRQPDCRGPVPRFQSRTRRRHRGGGQAGDGMSQRVVTVALKFEDDIVLARQRARQLARLLGFDAQDQTRIATSVSEIARNAFRYAGGGKVEFGVEGHTPPQLFEMVVSDQGPGITRLSEILEGSYRSSTGMGLGIIGARRLMDQFEITSAPGKGTQVVLRQLIPGGALFFG